jgi:hypothetical protein
MIPGPSGTDLKLRCTSGVTGRAHQVSLLRHDAQRVGVSERRYAVRVCADG